MTDDNNLETKVGDEPWINKYHSNSIVNALYGTGIDLPEDIISKAAERDWFNDRVINYAWLLGDKEKVSEIISEIDVLEDWQMFKPNVFVDWIHSTAEIPELQEILKQKHIEHQRTDADYIQSAYRAHDWVGDRDSNAKLFKTIMSDEGLIKKFTADDLVHLAKISNIEETDEQNLVLHYFSPEVLPAPPRNFERSKYKRGIITSSEFGLDGLTTKFKDSLAKFDLQQYQLTRGFFEGFQKANGDTDEVVMKYEKLNGKSYSGISTDTEFFLKQHQENITNLIESRKSDLTEDDLLQLNKELLNAYLRSEEHTYYEYLDDTNTHASQSKFWDSQLTGARELVANTALKVGCNRIALKHMVLAKDDDSALELANKLGKEEYLAKLYVKEARPKETDNRIREKLEGPIRERRLRNATDIYLSLDKPLMAAKVFEEELIDEWGYHSSVIDLARAYASAGKDVKAQELALDLITKDLSSRNYDKALEKAIEFDLEGPKKFLEPLNKALYGFGKNKMTLEEKTEFLDSLKDYLYLRED